MNLFQLGNFVLASGQKSNWKIECNALTNADWLGIAKILSEKISPFQLVYGVPTGGTKLATAMYQYSSITPVLSILIVDDVWTSGKSMNEYRKKIELAFPGANLIGGVVFARNKIEDWITPLFQMSSK